MEKASLPEVRLRPHMGAEEGQWLEQSRMFSFFTADAPVPAVGSQSRTNH